MFIAVCTGEAKAWSLEPNLGLSHGSQGPNYLNCHLLPTRSHVGRKLELEDLGSESMDFDMECGHGKYIFTSESRAHPVL